MITSRLRLKNDVDKILSHVNYFLPSSYSPQLLDLGFRTGSGWVAIELRSLPDRLVPDIRSEPREKLHLLCCEFQRLEKRQQA